MGSVGALGARFLSVLAGSQSPIAEPLVPQRPSLSMTVARGLWASDL